MDNRASAGHKLGQLIGDWFEQFFVLPLLAQVASELGLFLDHRFIERPARGEKIIWRDIEENEVDYDFVLELDGTPTQTGIPVAFIESCWQRGARHSKDKARDDSSKLGPMRITYPTARFLGMVVAGDFTEPSRDLIRSREVDLFYVPKDKIIKAFGQNELIMDYPDKATEDDKQQIAAEFELKFTPRKKKAIVKSLVTLMGKAVINSYVDRVRSKLSALPQEIRFVLRQDSEPVVFASLAEATTFLQNPVFRTDAFTESYLYQITFSDGSEFEHTAESLDELKKLHGQIVTLAEHMNNLTKSADG